MRVFTVEEPVYRTEPLFIIGCSHRDMRRYLLRRFKIVAADVPDGVCGQMLTFNAAPWRVVWIGNRSAGTLLHEIFHLVTGVLQDKGLPPICAHSDDGFNGDEAAAYLFEFFATRALRRLGRR